MGVMVKIEGLEDLNKVLRQIMPDETLRITRSALPVIAKDFAKAVSEEAPELTGGLAASAKGKRKNSKQGSRHIIEAAVSIEKPGRGRWHFNEFGTATTPENPFVLRAFQARKGDIEGLYVKAMVDKIVKRSAKVARSRGV